jgi:hypothetical protein
MKISSTNNQWLREYDGSGIRLFLVRINQTNLNGWRECNMLQDAEEADLFSLDNEKIR